MTAERHVAVIGGGIAGLSAADALLCANADRRDPATPLRVTLLEGSDRLGGKIRTETIAGQPIDVGAESLLMSTPGAAERCGRLGLRDQLIAPLSAATCIWTGGRLRPLPPGILAGMPDGVGPALRSRILTPAGIARAALDLVAPAQASDSERTIAEIVGGRLGRQVLERIVDPLIGTIYAAGCEELSAAASMPHIDAASRRHRSLLLGLRAAAAQRRAAPAPSTAPPAASSTAPSAAPPTAPAAAAGPPLATLPGGLVRLVDALAVSLRDAGADVRLGVRCGPLMRCSDGRYLLSLSEGPPLTLDGVVIAAPAPEAAVILAVTLPAATRLLRAISYASTIVASLRYPASAAPRSQRFSGLLVPRGQGRLLGAVTLLSAKWEHIRATGELWLRCSVARDRVAAVMHSSDGELIAGLAAELTEALGLPGPPLDAHIARWEQSLPIYGPGHLQRIDATRRELHALPAVELAGAAYGGIGVPSCMQQGEEAAQRVMRALRDPTQGTPEACPLQI